MKINREQTPNSQLSRQGLFVSEKLDSAAEQALERVSLRLSASGRGILAADESFPTIEKRFKKLGVESNERTRGDYRRMLFSAPGAGQFISGVILFEETLTQEREGEPLRRLLSEQMITLGLKVDKGTQPLGGSAVEKITVGLEDLPGRLQAAKQLGVEFAKWRAVISISEFHPSTACLEENAERLAHFAAACQQEGIVPIVEPEVLMEGVHTGDKCYEVTSAALREVFQKLRSNGVSLRGMLLKPNMVLPGRDCSERLSAPRIAALTLACMRESVPAEVPGIVFLSGGQTPAEAAENLREINRQKRESDPAMSFSFGRALQDEAMLKWSKGDAAGAQRAFLARAAEYARALQRENPAS